MIGRWTIFPFITLILILLLLFSCSKSIEDDDETKCIYSFSKEGAMSVGIFEVKEDNTFRYWFRGFGNSKNTEGRWYYRGNTIILHKYRDSTTTYGKIFLKSGTIPYFSLTGTDTLSLNDSNLQDGLKYHNPPKDTFYKVKRKKANMKIKKK
ncbi:hypothetical protein WAF17_07200 [Bernardetia sp. ABR2-2B]|uniref:hypothetical protein n=1 Tax=Bernardetia sp. ABR2-2B TaxID=3127472 RepID=UPI0030D223AE